MTNATADDRTDIPQDSWIDRLAPAGLRPYLRLARLDRPIGTWLLLLPCWWSTSLASGGGWPDVRLLALFAIGAIVMRAAGCTVNDLADRDIDGKVARTVSRPIANGDLTVTQAVAFLGLELLVGLVVLLQFNRMTIVVGIASLALVAFYPFAKRITYWPQFVLGLTFNWGAWLGWTAVHGELAWPAAVLYAAGICWTIGYDTIYGHQDKDDDILVGVKSTALKFGRDTWKWLIGFFAAAIVLLGLAGHLAGLAWPFYVGLAAAAAHAAWQIATLDIDDPKNCLKRFKSNRDFGLIVVVAIVLGQLAA